MDNKKERKVDNLINLVENHTRTERHLEQYAHIGDPKYKKMAIEKQNVRENQIESLKDQLVNEHKKISNEEELENVKNSYERTKNYLGNNFKNMSQEQITNMGNKEANQMRQIQRLEQNVDESGKYTL
ncbi:MAG: hypothetical protein IKK43_02420 [Clostridia bacterium]|nr:hypothetical protein [Clostridia bacterium]